MSKYEDNTMELIETVAENSHHNAAKPFGRGAMPKSIDVKSAEMGMLLERIDKMAEVKNLLLDRLNIHNGLKDSPLSHFKRRHDARLAQDSIMLSWIASWWQSKGKTCIDKVHREDQVNRDDLIIQLHILASIIPLFLTILRRITDIGGTTINPILHNTTVRNNKHTLIKDSRRSSRRLNRKPSRKLHARPRRHPTQSSALSRN